MPFLPRSCRPRTALTPPVTVRGARGRSAASAGRGSRTDRAAVVDERALLRGFAGNATASNSSIRSPNVRRFGFRVPAGNGVELRAERPLRLPPCPAVRLPADRLHDLAPFGVGVLDPPHRTASAFVPDHIRAARPCSRSGCQLRSRSRSLSAPPQPNGQASAHRAWTLWRGLPPGHEHRTVLDWSVVQDTLRRSVGPSADE